MQLVEANPVIDAVLGRYDDDLGAQAVMYRNHVYRGFNLHLTMSDLAESNELALAWVAHDLGLWTARTLDYSPHRPDWPKNSHPSSRSSPHLVFE